MRIAIGIEYDGAAYNGWQRQKSGTGVQELVERGLSIVADESVEATCAGRTDTGVHASAQVAHFDTRARRSERAWLLGTNSNLPRDINLLWVRQVADDFHARYSALSRSYRYVILNRTVRSALYRHRSWWVQKPLAAERMAAAAALIVGEHDFSAFRAAGCQSSTPVREVLSASVARQGDWIVFDVTANAFLQHMVRNLVGSLVAVGSGERPVEWMSRVLASRDRTRGGMAAPPQGLTLVAADYPTDCGIPPLAGSRREVLWL